MEPEVSHYFFQIISERYEKGSVVLTSNKSYGQWGEVFGDHVVATVILDRLLHHSTTINIKGDSYRIKERKKLVSTTPANLRNKSNGEKLHFLSVI